MSGTAKPHYTLPDRSHGGSTKEEIQDEPDWEQTHSHRIGFRDENDRHPGLTHVGDEWHTEQQRQFLARADEEAQELRTDLKNKKLINIREFMTKQEVILEAWQSALILALCLIHLSRTIT